MKRPIVTLLTDFGLADHYVAAMKGVILNICPAATLVDISHEVAPFAIPEAAYTLAHAWKNFPRGTAHLAVVDPGVGGPRRAIAAEVDGHHFVAPDNGLLSMILNGGQRSKIREISAHRYFRPSVSNTFHGRDIFSPVIAHLANGLPLSKLGKMISDPVKGSFTQPVQLSPNHWAGIVLKIDRFGNIISNLGWNEFSRIRTAPFKLKLGNHRVTHFYSTYSSAPQGQLFALEGSSGYVEISLNQANAAKHAAVVSGSPVDLLLC